MAVRFTRRTFTLLAVTVGMIGYWQAAPTSLADDGSCQKCNGTDRHCKRTISYQNKNDLFSNYYVGPYPSGTAVAMYVSPLPVPPYVGHTYTTYQPLMPHEYLYRHTRSHYSHVPGAGWTRTKVRYRTYGLRLQDIMHGLSGCY